MIVGNKIDLNELLENKLLNLMDKCFKAISSLANIDKKVEIKIDGTPITRADKVVDKLIRETLKHLTPDIPIISEEGNIKEDFFLGDLYWLIDPIDGTSSYLRGNQGYTINMAIICKGYPVFGIIGHPPSNTIWFAKDNKVIKRKNKQILICKKKRIDKEQIRVILSNNADNETVSLIKKIPGVRISKCSSSLKFCMIVEGKADLYPRLEGISKWDIAAGDALLRAYGGTILNDLGEEYNYQSLSSIR